MKRFALLLVAGCLSASTFAIYPNTGTDSSFTFVGRVGSGGGWGGSGTIISPYEVLTAKHVGGTTFYLDGNLANPYTATSRIEHTTGDLAILHFDTPLPYYSAPIYTDMIGKTATMVGFGYSANARNNGTGYNIDWSSAGVRRSGANKIEYRETTYLSPSISASVSIQYILDKQGTSDWVPGEAGVLFGDSGGGWFIQDAGQWRLVGVNSYIFDATGNGTDVNYNTFCDFGDGGAAVDLNQYRDWIKANTTPVPEPASMVALGLGLAGLVAKRRRR